MRNLIDLTDEQIEERFDEYFGVGVTIDDISFTRDSIDDFLSAAAGYIEHGSIEQDDDTLVIESVQVRKGETRSDLYVIDFGEVRGCCR